MRRIAQTTNRRRVGEALGGGEPVQVFEPHRHRMPPLGAYLRELWRRRRFAVHMARTNLKARNYDTLFGQLWSILNPLLLGLIYYLVFGVILGGSKGNASYLAALLSGLFAFYYTRNCIAMGATSIVTGGRLIMNTAFPRAILPVSTVASALLMYLPTLAVYAGFHLLGGEPVGPQLLFVPLLVAIHTVFNLGLAMLFAALTVYFRDTSSFLPYILRIWLYLSPVIYTIEQVPPSIRPAMGLNPLYPLLGAWHQVIIQGRLPNASLLAYSCVWAVAALLIGSWFFMSREREFAVRI